MGGGGGTTAYASSTKYACSGVEPLSQGEGRLRGLGCRTSSSATRAQKSQVRLMVSEMEKDKGAPLGSRVCRQRRPGFSKVYPNWDATGMHPGCRIGEWLHIGGHFRGMTRGCKGRGMGCGCSSRVSIEAGIVEVLGYANTGVCTKEAAHFPASKNRFPPSVAVPPAWTAPSP